MEDLRKEGSFPQITTGFHLVCLKTLDSFLLSSPADLKRILSFLRRMATFHLAEKMKEVHFLRVAQVTRASYHLSTQVTRSLLITQLDLKEVDISLHIILVDLTIVVSSLLDTLADFQMALFQRCTIDLPHSISDHPTI